MVFLGYLILKMNNKNISNEIQILVNQFNAKNFDKVIEKGKLVVLGDWFHRPSYAVFDGEDLELKHWEDDE